MRDPAFELNCFLTRSVYSSSWRSCWVISAPTKGRYASRSQGGANSDNGGQTAPRAHLDDGLLQWLTGTTLQPETARRRVETDPQTVGGSLIHSRVARGQATRPPDSHPATGAGPAGGATAGPFGDCSLRSWATGSKFSGACPWYRAWTPSRPRLPGAGAAWPASPMAALRERRAPGRASS